MIRTEYKLSWWSFVCVSLEVDHDFQSVRIFYYFGLSSEQKGFTQNNYRKVWNKARRYSSGNNGPFGYTSKHKVALEGPTTSGPAVWDILFDIILFRSQGFGQLLQRL